ncbi:hypothetical protein DMENIID0001_056920 [Sergentomyia squamirostris]
MEQVQFPNFKELHDECIKLSDRIDREVNTVQNKNFVYCIRNSVKVWMQERLAILTEDERSLLEEDLIDWMRPERISLSDILSLNQGTCEVIYSMVKKKVAQGNKTYFAKFHKLICIRDCSKVDACLRHRGKLNKKYNTTIFL